MPEATTRKDSAAPDTLGRYSLLAELGRGAHGRVFLAHDPQIDRRVAIKTVDTFAALAGSERVEARARFLREARAVGRLAHPGIVTLYDVCEEGERLFLVMEYVEGETLDRFCRPPGLLPRATAVALVAAAARALDAAHGTGIVHRDIKPANLIRVGATAVKITDFGLAKPAATELTQDGAVLGSPSYMAPEQIRGAALDGRADLFSLAVVLWELLSGRRPFPGDDVSSVLYRIVHEPPAAMGEPALPASLERFLERALAKSPAERPQSGRAFAAELEAAAGSLAAAGEPEGAWTPAGPPRAVPPVRAATSPGPSAPPRELPPPAAEHTLRVWPFILAAALLLAAVAGGMWWKRGGGLAASRAEAWLETRVRSEPADLVVRLDGIPLAPGELVRFREGGPYGTLTAARGCRTLERTLEPADAGGEIVLALEPTELAFTLDPGVLGARVAVNGERVGTPPVELALDLCRATRVELTAQGYHPRLVEIPAGATPDEARLALERSSLERIPTGTLELSPSSLELEWSVDGERLRPGTRRLELEQGEHRVRMKNDFHWIDATTTVRISGGETLRVPLAPPELATLRVQAFPANCNVSLRRPGGRWREVDETPFERRIAPGRYEVRVELKPTGERREQVVELDPGQNPPVRVSFARS